MIGYILGSACGAIELLLLSLLVRGISAGSVKVWVIFAKVTVLAVFFLPCTFWMPDQLYRAGIAAAAVLIVGSVFMFAMAIKKEKHSPNKSQPPSEGDAT